MRYERRLISPKRCQEIDAMKIPNPLPDDPKFYPPFFVMERDYHYLASEDESLILAYAFTPVPADRWFFEDVYLLVKGDEYYLFSYQRRESSSQKIGDMFYVDSVLEIGHNLRIEQSPEKEEVLRIISEMLRQEDGPDFRHRYFFRHTVCYHGEEI